ncbi:MAG: galactose-1-phosphate uridylyltransferase [Acidobacteria bacterium]|nr:galactose-1-phosphate uridylyltransferase [Acidobacteriota bacterium]
MVELRRDPVVERWITIPRERAASIEGLFPGKQEVSRGACPFCPTAMHEREIYSIKDDQGRWSVLVVPDLRPILEMEGTLERRAKGIYDGMSGVGAHEIVIETREHNQSWATMAADQLGLVLRAYRDRSSQLRGDKRFRAIFMAKNYGGMASRFSHPHSHVLALPIVPRTLVEEVQGSEDYFQYKERCVWCDVKEQELAKSERTVALTDRFLVHTPYASRYPFELNVMPFRHVADFASSTDEEIADLGGCLRTTFEIVKNRLHDPSYSMIIHSVPLRNASEHSYHWHIEIRPQLTSLAGFEWGTGFFTNPIPPEVAAQHLRG